MPDDRAELLAALHQITALPKGLLTRAGLRHRRAPSADELAAMREGVVSWREQFEGF
jgi:hypothetical protein